MPVFFKMSGRGLASINRSTLSEPIQILLFKILCNHGQMPLTMEQLFAYISAENGSDRKIAARFLYKMLHSGWLLNIEEDEVSTTVTNEPPAENSAQIIASLQDVVNNNHIILSEQYGLLIASLGFSDEQSINLAANVAELIKNHSQKFSENDFENTAFPFLAKFKWQDVELEVRLFQIHDLCFVITTKSTSILNETLYFNLIFRLIRRYGCEYQISNN